MAHLANTAQEAPRVIRGEVGRYLDIYPKELEGDIGHERIMDEGEHLLQHESPSCEKWERTLLEKGTATTDRTVM